MSEFQTWLNDQLRQINTDESIFGTYIIGILEGEEETQDEKIEALEGILSGTDASNIEELVASILQKWLQSHPSADEPCKKGMDIDVNAQLAKLLDQQKLQPAVKEREYTEEELRIKQQILAQYSETAVSEGEDEDTDGEDGEPSGSGVMAPNTNRSNVANLAKEKREQARLESAAKKQKDKEDREKQKQLREEKKEKRKTVKGERRR